MRRVVSLSMLGLAAGMLSGCDLKEVYPTAIPPMAGVRFINAVPDTGGAYGLDMRFVDILESNAQFRHLFRSQPTTAGGVTASARVQYKHARAGTRNFKVFLDDTIQSIASTELFDETFDFQAGRNYTVLVWGYANPGGPGRPVGAPAMSISIFEETVVAPGTDVAIRLINATGNAIDGEQYLATGAPSGTATWTNVAPLSVSTHVTNAPRQTRVTLAPTAGGSTVLYGTTNPLGLIGTPASGPVGSTILDIEALPGTTVAGSAVSFIVFPPSVRGSTAAQFTTAIATGRRISAITDQGGGVFRVTDCFVSGTCLPAAPAATNPNIQVGGCAPDAFGDCLMTITPPSGSPLPPITVSVSANTNGTIDTTTDLTAYLGNFDALGVSATYSITGWHAGVTSVWDRRPPYVQ